MESIYEWWLPRNGFHPVVKGFTFDTNVAILHTSNVKYTLCLFKYTNYEIRLIMDKQLFVSEFAKLSF